MTLDIIRVYEYNRTDKIRLTNVKDEVKTGGIFMGIWNPWRGCHRYSTGCKYCYIHKGDYKKGIDTNAVQKTEKFYAPIEKTKNGTYKMKSGQMVYVCFSSDFLIEDADGWRAECWEMIRERSDLHFLFLTKRIERFLDCIPNDWNNGYENVTVGCTVENQENADYRLGIFSNLPIKHKNIVCQPLIENINLSAYLHDVELVVVGTKYYRSLNRNLEFIPVICELYRITNLCDIDVLSIRSS